MVQIIYSHLSLAFHNSVFALDMGANGKEWTYSNLYKFIDLLYVSRHVNILKRKKFLWTKNSLVLESGPPPPFMKIPPLNMFFSFLKPSLTLLKNPE